MKNRTDDIIHLIKHHSGHAYQQVPNKVLEAFIRYEWNSNRWAMVVEPITEKVLGWISWYNLDAESISEVKRHGLPDCYAHNITLYGGDHIYICNAVVRDGVPIGIFRLLWNMAVQANPEAVTINAHLRNRKDQPPRWFCKVMRSRRLAS